MHRAVPGVFHRQRTITRRGDQFRQLHRAFYRYAVHPAKHIPRTDAAIRRRTCSALQFADANHQHAVGMQRNAQRLPAGNQPLLRRNLHLHPPERYAHQRQQQFRRARRFAGQIHDALVPQMLVRGKGYRHIPLRRTEAQPRAQGKTLRPPLGQGNHVRHAAQCLLRRREVSQRQKQGAYDPHTPAQYR